MLIRRSGGGLRPKDVTLEKLHELIQTAMGWTNSHLHQFEIADTRYTDPRFMMNDFEDFGAMDYSGMRVSDLVSEHGAKLLHGLRIRLWRRLAA